MKTLTLILLFLPALLSAQDIVRRHKAAVSIVTDSTAWTSPGAATSGGTGDISWTTETDALTSNNSYARADLQPEQNTQYLVLHEFGFNVPAGATILGAKVQVEDFQTEEEGIQDFEVFLSSDAPNFAIEGDSRAGSTTLPTSDPNAYRLYGNNTDLWGMAMDEGVVEGASFGILLRYIHPGAIAAGVRVDHAQIKLIYQYTP